MLIVSPLGNDRRPRSFGGSFWAVHKRVAGVLGGSGVLILAVGHYGAE